MIAIYTTEHDLRQALYNVNKQYDGNISFNREPEIVGNRLRFTLKVKDSHKKGARTGFTGRHLINACWHVHGNFFEELFKLNNQAIIIANGKQISVNGGNWEDRSIGSIMNPLYYSEACKCGED